MRNEASWSATTSPWAPTSATSSCGISRRFSSPIARRSIRRKNQAAQFSVLLDDDDAYGPLELVRHGADARRRSPRLAVDADRDAVHARGDRKCGFPAIV